MRITKWHVGKLVILWSWGALIAALSLTIFLSSPVTASPLAHLVALSVALLTLLVLSSLTWIWLGGREGDSTGLPTEETDDSDDE